MEEKNTTYESKEQYKECEVEKSNIKHNISTGVEIVPPRDRGWLKIRNKTDVILVGSGEDLVVISYRCAKNVTVCIKTANGKPICRLRHLTEEQKEKLKPYIPEMIFKSEDIVGLNKSSDKKNAHS